jgi:hypothetical protein
MFEYFMENRLFVANIFELLAALAGTYYLNKTKTRDIGLKLFVYNLWFILLIEIFGMYAAWNYFDDYRTFPGLKNSVLASNYWLFNSAKIIFITVFFNVFISRITSLRLKKILYGLTLFFIISCIVNYIFSDIFFKAFSSYTTISGSLILLFCIGSFYYEMLLSNKILYFYKNLPFYISIGAMLWHLSITPLFIYNRYLNNINPEFVNFHIDFLRYANIFMYSSFAIGFLICSSGKMVLKSV